MDVTGLSHASERFAKLDRRCSIGLVCPFRPDPDLQVPLRPASSGGLDFQASKLGLEDIPFLRDEAMLAIQSESPRALDLADVRCQIQEIDPERAGCLALARTEMLE